MKEGEDRIDVGQQDVGLATRFETADDPSVSLEDALAEAIDVVDQIEIALC